MTASVRDTVHAKRVGPTLTPNRARVLLRPFCGEAFGQIRRIVRNGRHEAPRVVQLVEFGAPGVEILAAPACDDDGRWVGQLVESHEQRSVCVRKLLQHAPGRAQRALGRIEVASLA